MNKVLAVIRREFIERVRTRAFLIGTLLVPALAGIFGYLPQALAKRQSATQGIVLLDAASGSAGADADSALAGLTFGSGTDVHPRFSVTRLPASGRLAALRDSVVATIGLKDGPESAPEGVIILTDSAIASGQLTYLGSNVTSFRDMNLLDSTLEPIIREARLRSLSADSAVIRAAGVHFRVDATKVTEGKVTGQSGEASFWLAYVVNLLMYMTLLLYGVQVMTAVIEEKSNRVVEVLVSSLSPFQLLLGKVIGVGAVGLVQLAIWGGTGFYLTTALGPRSTPMNEVGGAAPPAFTMPAVSADLIIVVLVSFLLGFFLYSSLYAAIGAMCNSQQEAQQANTPVTMVIALGMISMFALINEPSGTMARVLTFIPLFTPIVLPVRYAIAPLSVAEVSLAALTMVLAILAVVWIAARIYRVGILSYGKKPTLRELARWVRTT
ncbi:MAG TPA: ABC transporter permease [Gemmatimonadales bacterium]|nr:ABC transporter permease [Gemmatimonadales bacterium]